MRKFLLILPVILSACTSVPSTNVHQPMSVRPPFIEKQQQSGAIYTPHQASLFEDRKAREVGDILTVKIVENTNANNKTNSKLDRNSSSNASVPVLTGLPGKTFLGLGLETSSKNNFNGAGSNAKSNILNGNITVTVIDVYNNGNLLVSGEKQISIGNETEFIRLSGVVNPKFIDGFNSIESNKIADARIEYKSNGQNSEATVMPWLSRIFMNILPF